MSAESVEGLCFNIKRIYTIKKKHFYRFYHFIVKQVKVQVSLMSVWSCRSTYHRIYSRLNMCCQRVLQTSAFQRTQLLLMSSTAFNSIRAIHFQFNKSRNQIILCESLLNKIWIKRDREREKERERVCIYECVCASAQNPGFKADNPITLSGFNSNSFLDQRSIINKSIP